MCVGGVDVRVPQYKGVLGVRECGCRLCVCEVCVSELGVRLCMCVCVCVCVCV